jgi:DnaJ-class molecular chaperone
VIVSRKMAEEAASDLCFVSMELFDGAVSHPLDVMTKEAVQQAYKNLVKLHHPDKGGSAEAFVRIDRAKCVLLGWLERRASEEPSAAVSSVACPMCHGSGRRTLRRGFHSMTMMCGTCRGHGEMVPNEKVEE